MNTYDIGTGNVRYYGFNCIGRLKTKVQEKLIANGR